MAKECKTAVVSRLRFPEFRIGPEWRTRVLGPMTSKVGSGITPLGGDKKYKAQGRPFVRSQNVGWGELLLNDVAHIDEETHRSFDATEIEENDVLLNITGASIGRSAVADSRIVGGNVNQHVCIVRAKADELNPVLLNQFLISERGQKQIDGFQAGGNRQGLNFSQIRSFEIPVAPTEREQQRVADCLTSLDDVIAAQGRKVETLKTYKRGLMQRLFPGEGKTLPDLRFPEFRDGPGWEEAQLGDLFDTASGGTPDRAKTEYWNGTIPWVTTSLIDFNVITNVDEFISDAGLANSSTRVLPKDTVLIAMYGQGKTRGKVAMLGIAAATNQACAAILPNGTINPQFTFANLCGRYDEMRALSNSGGQENLSQGLVRGLSFRYPKDVKEQSKIVGCLTSLDFDIHAESDRLETLRIHKKGLMQQLFPAQEEV